MFFMRRKGSVVTKSKPKRKSRRSPSPPPDDQDLSQYLRAVRGNKPTGDQWNPRAEKSKKDFKSLVNKTMAVHRFRTRNMRDSSTSVQQTNASNSVLSRRNSNQLYGTFSEEEWKTIREQQKLNYLKEREERRIINEKKFREAESEKLRKASEYNLYKAEMRQKYLNMVDRGDKTAGQLKKRVIVRGNSDRNKEGTDVQKNGFFGDKDLCFSQILEPGYIHKNTSHFNVLKNNSSSSEETETETESDTETESESEDDVSLTSRKTGKFHSVKEANEKFYNASNEGDINFKRFEDISNKIEDLKLDTHSRAENTLDPAPSGIMENVTTTAVIERTNDVLHRAKTPENNPSSRIGSSVSGSVQQQLKPIDTNTIDPERSTVINSARNLIKTPEMKRAERAGSSVMRSARNHSSLIRRSDTRISKTPQPSPRRNFQSSISPQGSPNRSVMSDPGTRNKKLLSVPRHKSAIKSAPSLHFDPSSPVKDIRPSPRRAFENSPSKSIKKSLSPRPSPFKSLSLNTSGKNKISPSPVPSPKHYRKNSMKIEDVEDSVQVPSPRTPMKIASLKQPVSVPIQSNERKDRMKERREQVERKKKEQETATQLKLNPTSLKKNTSRRQVDKHANIKSLERDKEIKNMLGWANSGSQQTVGNIIRTELL